MNTPTRRILKTTPVMPWESPRARQKCSNLPGDYQELAKHFYKAGWDPTCIISNQLDPKLCLSLPRARFKLCFLTCFTPLKSPSSLILPLNGAKSPILHQVSRVQYCIVAQTQQRPPHGRTGAMKPKSFPGCFWLPILQGSRHLATH